jgi:hypothetical protein
MSDAGTDLEVMKEEAAGEEGTAVLLQGDEPDGTAALLERAAEPAAATAVAAVADGRSDGAGPSQRAAAAAATEEEEEEGERVSACLLNCCHLVLPHRTPVT